MLLVLINNGGTVAQKYNFVSYTVEDGLAQSQPVGVTQDHKRNLWIATLGGLSRFDGKSFTNYTTNDGLLSSRTSSLFIDRANNILVGTQLGLSIYNGKTFTNFKLNNNGVTSSVRAIIEDNAGVIFFTYNGMLYEVRQASCKRILLTGIDTHNVSAIGNDRNNELLVAFSDGKLFKKEINGWKKITCVEKGLAINKIYTSATGRTWLLTNKGVLIYTRDSIIAWNQKVAADITTQATSIYESRDSSVWIGQVRGAYKIKNGIVAQFTKKNGFTDNHILNIFGDVEGNTWFSSNGAGLLKFSSDIVSYFDESSGIPNPIVVGITRDKNEDLLFGTYGGGLCKYNGSIVSHIKIPSTNIRAQTINFCIRDKSNNSWIGTNGGGLWLLKENKFTNISDKFHCSELFFLTAALSDAGLLYFGTTNGLYTFSENNLQKIHSVPEYINAIYTKGNDTAFIGSSQGVIFLVKQQRTPIPFSRMLEKCTIQTITGSTNGIYFGTSDNGIFIIDLQHPSPLIQISQKEGLSSNNIYSLAIDSNNVVWAATGYNINSITLNNDKSIANIKIYDKGEGIFAAEGNQNSLFIDADNSVWAGTVKGLYHIKKNAGVNKTLPSVVILKSVSLFSLPITEKKYFDSLSAFDAIPVNLRLPYKKNHLSFRFQAINFTNPADIKYQYYIKGIDTGFLEKSSSNSVVYTNINPGKYTMMVRAISNGGSLVSATLEYNFEIEMPFHQTIYFKIIIVLCLIIAGALIPFTRAKLKERTKKTVELLRAEEQYKIRKRTAEDFHDEMGNKLTRISILSEMMKSKLNDKEAILDIIGQIKENVLMLFSGTRDIIWSLGNESNDLFFALTRIRDFGIDLFQDTGIIFTYSGLNDQLNSRILPPDFSRNLVLIFKEGMNNILKHSGSTAACFSIHSCGYDEIEIILKDDGKGFDRNNIVSGHGINNIRLRAGRINAPIDFYSSHKTGTVITLKLKIP
ncbi:MAG: two-component regulator propeller domain-containing protein [Ferruginibacter sp.]